MKRQIKDGAGAGYEIDSVLTDFNVIDATLSGIKIRETAYGDRYAVIQCDIECTANIKSAFSYMYGRELDIKTPCKITAVAIDKDYLDNENGQDATDFIYQALDNYGVELKVKEYYGGGWSHSKYDGTVCQIDDANGYVSTLNAEDFPSGIIALDASISNSQIIDFIDRLVSDNATNVFYAVCMGHSNSDNALEYFDEEVDADRYAEELSEENKGTEYRIIEVTEYEDENGDIYDIEEDERGSYYMDEDDEEFEDDEITDSVRRVKDSESEIKAVIDDFVKKYYPEKTVEEYNINGEGNELLACPYIDGCWAYVFKSEEDAEQYVLSGAFNDMLNGATDFDSWVHILESNGVETDYAEELLESGNWDEITRIMLDGEGCEFFMSGYAGQAYYVDDHVIYF